MAKQRNRIRRVLRKRTLLLRVALAVTAASLVLPAAAGAYTVAGGSTGATSDNGAQTSPGGTSHAIVLHRDGSQAVAFDATPGSGAAVGTTDGGFDWGDAMIGAGGVLGLIAFVGAGGLTIRSRRRLASAAPTHG